MKVSIIIPVYGVEDYIEDCLRSVAAQQFDGDIECLIVDDCSTDQSIERAQRFISEYAGSINFSIITREKNGGLSEARNSGLDAASGDYIYFLDSDDELLPDAIKELTEVIRRQECDLVIGDYIVTGAEHVFPRLYLSDNTTLCGQAVADSYCRNEWYMMAVNKLYSAKFLKESGLRFYPGLIHEDELWSFQCALRANSIAAIRKDTYNYKVRPGSIMTAQKAGRRAKSYKIILTGILKEVMNSKKEYSVDVHRFVRHKLFQFLTISVSLPNCKLFETYISYRQSLPAGYLKLLKFSRLSPKQLLRDAHLLLPARIGFKMLNNHFSH